MKTILALAAFAATTTFTFAKAPEPTAPVELKNKSSFKKEESGRNPFWPVGWKPTPKFATAATVEHAGPDIPATAFVVSSITYDRGARYAIINGQPMTEGQQFGLQMGTSTYQLTVKSIDDGHVTLTRQGHAEISVSLRRR